MEIIFKLIDYWKTQNIIIQPNSLERIEQIIELKKIILSEDFLEYYHQVNGMGELYANFDKNGFSFYPVEELKTLEMYYKSYYGDIVREDIGELKKIIIFADYMHESWLYGVNVINATSYEIGSIAHYGEFNVISNSLSDFFKLYMEDNEILYAH